MRTKTNAFAIVGRIPPPFGGVSVHMSRALDLFRRDGIDAVLYDMSGRSDERRGVYPVTPSAFGFLTCLATCKETCLHFHLSNPSVLSLVGVIMRMRPSKRYLVTVHSENLADSFRQGTWIRKRLIRNYCRRAEHVICVSENLTRFVRDELGIDSSRISHIPAFITPTNDETCEKRIPRKVRSFIDSKDKVVGTHGWFGYFRNGEHVYRFDQIAKLAREFADSGQNIGIYTVISGTYEARAGVRGGEAHAEQIRALQRELADHWMVIEEAFPSPSLYKLTDLFVRPTTTDGDSLSVRECLALDVPVLASDVVSRPPACVVYESGNYSALSAKVWEMLGDGTCRKSQGDSVVFDDQLLAVVRDMIGS